MAHSIVVEKIINASKMKVKSFSINQLDLKELPSEIGELQCVERLHINCPQLERVPPQFSKLTNLISLDLCGSQLISFPAEICRLVNLEWLYLSQNALIELPPEISNLTKLRTLQLSNNQLFELPNEIGKLHNLNTLNIRYNSLQSLPPGIGGLKNLETFLLRDNILSELPQGIGNLSKLKTIELKNNRLRELPPKFSNLIHIASLELQNNRLEDLPIEISNLFRLNQINLKKNKIKKIPEGLSQIENLALLDLSYNEIKKISSKICECKNLEKLNLNKNKITNITKNISQLSNLKSLSINSNELMTVRPEISKLTKLIDLDLSFNNLRKLPELIGELTNLEDLNLNSNQLSDLPSGISKLNRLIRLRINSNPLISPPLEIASQGLHRIVNYLGSLKGENKILNEAKILLVGDGSSGKTSLTRRLLGESFNKNERTTHGIRIKNWETVANDKTIKVNLWDFGGQEIMHATHQFFLSKRSLYVLVLDGRRDEKPEYWLRYVESFGGDSPIIVVLNKYDSNPSFDINRPFLKKKYPSIKGFFNTSCSTNHGIDIFKRALIQELSKIELVETRWALSWFKVKEKIELSKKDYISQEEYEQICIDNGIEESLSKNILVEFLHDLGIILHFEDFNLDDIHVLNPRWVTEAVYRIINSNYLAINTGVLKLKDLKDILKPNENSFFYPRDKQKYIITLMKKFELCYQLDEKTVLLPPLLNIIEPSFNFNYEDSLQFVFNYADFLPPSIMPRFIVRTHRDIKNELCWRSGIILENIRLKTTAVIIADNESRKIKIFVNGFQKKDYLAVIILFFRSINQTFKKLKVSELVPMPDNPSITANYQTLINSAEAGIKEIIPDGSDKVYKVHSLLGMVHFKPDYSLEEIITAIHTIEGKETNSIVDKANSIVDVKPNFFGVGVNLNNLYKLVKKVRNSKEK